MQSGNIKDDAHHRPISMDNTLRMSSTRTSSSTPTHISVNHSTVTINHFGTPMPKLLPSNEEMFHSSHNNGTVISPSSKQHETCQSVPRSPQTQQQHHHLHHHHHHPLYSGDQQQSFMAIPHAPIYADLQPFPSAIGAAEMGYPENGATSTTNSYFPTNSSSSTTTPSALHSTSTSSGYYLTTFPTSSSASSVIASNTIVDYPQSVRL